MRKIPLALASAVLFSLPFLATAQSGAAAGAQARPLATILETAASAGHGEVAEAELDHGVWEVTVCRSAACQKLYVDPAGGQVLRRKATDPEALPPSGARPIADIVRAIDAQRTGTVTGVEFEHGRWQIKLEVDPLAGGH